MWLQLDAHNDTTYSNLHLIHETFFCVRAVKAPRVGGKVVRTAAVMVLSYLVYWQDGERSGSVVECLTRDRGARGSRLTGVTALCP